METKNVQLTVESTDLYFTNLLGFAMFSQG